MSKFKVGDRVRCVNSVGAMRELSSGKTYVVNGLNGSDLRLEGCASSWMSSRFELAPRFTVGDKVRAVRDSIGGGYTKGKTYVVKTCRDNHIKTEFDDSGSRTNGWGADNFEPAYTSCAAAEVDNLAAEYGAPAPWDEAKPKFKVGDRVRRINSDNNSFMRIGTEWTVKRLTNYCGEDYLEFEGGNDGAAENFDLVAVAPATAPALTIQAGRYYKTRDGRKVGPMVMECGGTCRAGSLWFFADTGRTNGIHETDNDLIAEWQDDVPLRGVSPVVAPATSAKFKVGDRVRQSGWREDYWCTVTHVGPTSITIKDDNGNSAPYDNLADFIKPTTIASIGDIVRKHSGTAIVCLIENGQPKPSTLPFVHSNKDAAATEASRLAGIHKGQEFGVYECVDVRKVERVYEHEWQRLAADGETYKAKFGLAATAGIEFHEAATIVNNWLKRAV